MVSGGCRQGFRLSWSDRDTMFWLNNHLVVSYFPLLLYHGEQFVFIYHDTQRFSLILASRDHVSSSGVCDGLVKYGNTRSLIC